MSRGQAVFSVALVAITTLVLVVGAYVTSSPAWGDRWYNGRRGAGRRRRKR